MNSRGVFITGTDTGVGKTVATFVLGTLLKDKGLDIGCMKPIQCAGNDAQFLKKALRVSDTLSEINPFLAPEPLSPHLAFVRAGKSVDIKRILQGYAALQVRHDLTLVEGAGGLLVPLRKGYLVADLIRELEVPVVIVSRLGLGAINHTLLTLEAARQRGLTVLGVLFSQAQKTRRLPEKTNPQAIKIFGKIPVLGVIPFMPQLTQAEVRKRCREKIDLAPFFLAQPKETAKDWPALDKKYLWHPFTQMKDWQREEPLVIAEARGSYLKDTAGRWYLDGVSSLWVNVHGHRHPAIDAAVKAQVDRMSHSTLLGLSHPPAIALAEALVKIAPKGLTKVFYSDNGSTAVEIAIKMAYQYWQNVGRKKKHGIVHFEHSYHGDTLGSVSVGGIDLFHRVYRDLRFKTIKVRSPYVWGYKSGAARPQATQAVLNELEDLFKTAHDRIAAIVLEPGIQAAAGMLIWPKGVLKDIERFCRRYDILLVVDEVATGFGRTGKMFACEDEDVCPDLLCLAKGLTGGYFPLSATLTTQRIFDGFVFPYSAQKTFFHGHTYTGNPLGAAAALANLEVFRKEKTLYNLAPKIALLKEELKGLGRLAHVGEIRQKGLMVGIELVKDKAGPILYPWEDKVGARVCREVRREGVILRPLGNVIVVMPPLSISLQDLKRLLAVVSRAIRTVTEDTKAFSCFGGRESSLSQ